mmetsp:Transcript_19249/g.28667  ORF Transcript_19249/g.28667 Transcript_19249/m.28667 type:complete len:196 (+) Transcript_19249:25-612(+)|eukprot:CAMPEP_0201552744 /NCGR_PEP_ID=MMETSP0173_2-20130828/17257_1 /ASSEMBLY_ACC=CAM_ASM_000268 /TAXON_ID=218659 /ORGANISM="Vexillifera sp., Strain DIVA3 564/2" /LENGTH=195 /DNA_ID=CAMNT_0047963277 /DNA_START=22 /DNA_END=609 /DNA_ORIENTATION=+
MGNQPSAGLPSQDLEDLKISSNFTEEELKRLYRRFKKLDTDNSNTLTTDEFLSVPELAGNPLLERVIAIFDKNKDDEIEFKEFITALSTFSEKGNKEDKLKFAFGVYDMDGDGFISNGELFQVLKMMVGDNLDEVQLQQIVDKTILEADKDKDGRISFDEFKQMIENTDEIDKKMTIVFPGADSAASSSDQSNDD